jgi:hypothetical protein
MTVKRSAKIIKLEPPLRCAEPTPADMQLEEDDTAWASRSGMWQSRVEKASARRTKRAKAQRALILAGHGVSLRVENGALTIQNGFTHYPQRREIIRYFRGDVALPERIILLDGSGSISFDVLSWLAEQKVSLIRIDWKGDIVCLAAASGYSANPFRVRWQWEIRENPQKTRAICYRLQEQAFGGLSASTGRLLLSLVNPGAEPPRRVKVGSLLIREYQGVVHEVSLVPGGFCWQGKTCDSLSTIAKTITGTSWNGPRFFGLRSRKISDQEEDPTTGGAFLDLKHQPSSSRKGPRRPGRRSCMRAAVSGDAGGGS